MKIARHTSSRRKLVMSNFYITYFAKKHKKIITRKGQFDKPDGTPSEKGAYLSKQGEPVLNYWDLDANGWRNATGQVRIKWN